MWKRYNGDPIKGSLIDEVEQTILREKKSGHRIRICIGTDSQERNGHIAYATVIVFLRERSGGFMFVNKEHQRNGISIKERMMQEVARSVNIAYKLSDLLRKHNVEVEVHADINSMPQYKSNKAFSDAMGYIKGMGFVFKAKPHSFASSSCADKVVN